jgi:hypothetical protein
VYSNNKKQQFKIVGMSTCPAQTISTDTELDATYGGGVKVGVLPNVPNGSSERDDKSKLLATTITTIISNLKNKGIIPSPSGLSPDAFILKQQTLIQNLQEEYCFYESRYRYALENLFSAISNGYLSGSLDNKSTVQNYLNKTQILNKRLNDLTQIMNGITENMLSTSDTIQNEIEQFNKRIKAQKDKLDTQNKIIMTGDATTNIRKQMVKYTEEKGKYTDNLLNLYSFLNIVALGLLVYVYKAAGNE